MLSGSDTLKSLQKEFKDKLPGKIALLVAQYRSLKLSHWQPRQARELHHQLHSLTGSTGAFGLQSISTATRQLEIRLKAIIDDDQPPDDQVWQQIGDELDRLTSLTASETENWADRLLPPARALSPKHSPLVYLIEDDPEQNTHIVQLMREHGFWCRCFTTQSSFIEAWEQAVPDAVVLDIGLSESHSGGLDLLRRLKSDSAAMPPVVMVSVDDDLDCHIHAYRAGVTRYLSKPIVEADFVAVMEQLTGRLPAEPYRVLLVDDEPDLLRAQSIVLESAGIKVKSLSEPKQTLQLLDDFKPDVLVLDVYMPDIHGPEIAAVVRERSEHINLPILFLSAETDITQQLSALNLGGDDFLVKPILAEHFVAAVRARAHRYRQSQVLQQRMKQVMYEREREHLALNHHSLVSISDRKGDIIYVNDKFCQTSGYDRSELLGKNHRLVKSDAHAPNFYKGLWRTIASGQIWQGEICNRRKDGRYYWVSSTIMPLVGKNGKPYQYVSIRTDITYQKTAEQKMRRAEQQIEQSKERLRQGQLYANIGTWEWDIESGDLYWTERIAPLFGYPEGNLETSYENFIGAIHPDDRARVSEAVTACIERDEPYEIEHRVVWPDGTVRWLLERGAAQRDASGKPERMLGVVQDIHDRKCAEVALAEREQQLLQAQRLAKLGNWHANLVSGDLFWSDEVYRIFGYTPGTIKPDVALFHKAVHPDDRALVRESEKQAQQTGHHDIVHRILLDTGELRYVHELGTLHKDENGNPKYLTGTVQDVTERVQAEQSLYESQQSFTFAVEGAGDGIWDWDVITGSMLMSGNYESMLGYQPGELSPDIETWRRSIHPQDREAAENQLVDYMAGRSQQFSVELRLRCKDGSYKWVLCRSSVVARNNSNEPVRLIGIHSDINQRKRNEEALILAREEADRANQAKSEFLSSMSHELRTPMNAILGFGQLMEYDEAMPEEQQDNVQEILKAGEHLLGLINEVLDLAKIESGQISLSVEPLALSSVVEECVSLTSAMAEKNAIRMKYDCAAGVEVKADRTRLKQVLLNLISNAIKYNREKGSVKIEVVTESGEWVRISVHDTGYGIEEKHLEQLFQPFNRLNAESSNIEGTGIGLTITRRIIEMLGGTIDVESQVSKGSTFSVRLPLTAASSDTSKGLQSGGELLQQSGTHVSKADNITDYTVIYIEDNPANLKLVTQALARMPQVRMLSAPSPLQGLELINSQLPDLILLDINMPEMDGYQLQSILSSSKRTAHIPVIAVTANAMPDDVKKGKQAGFDEYVTKPINIKQLIGLVNKYLGGERNE